MKAHVLIGLLLLVSALALACGDNGGDSSSGATVMPGAAEATETPEQTESPSASEVDAILTEEGCVYLLRYDNPEQAPDVALGSHLAFNPVPSNFILGDFVEFDDGIIEVAVSEELDPELETTLIAPPCKRDEILELLSD